MRFEWPNKIDICFASPKIVYKLINYRNSLTFSQKDFDFLNMTYKRTSWKTNKLATEQRNDLLIHRKLQRRLWSHIWPSDWIIQKFHNVLCTETTFIWWFFWMPERLGHIIFQSYLFLCRFYMARRIWTEIFSITNRFEWEKYKIKASNKLNMTNS